VSLFATNGDEPRLEEHSCVFLKQPGCASTLNFCLSRSFFGCCFEPSSTDRCRNSGSEIRLPYPVGPFFQTRLARGLLRCLPILIPTMFRGRFFCGWMCPLGLVEPLLQQTEVRAQKRQATAGIESLQTLATTKSYLGWSTHCCPSGYGVVAWLDPFSFLVRSLSLSVAPSTNYALQAAWSFLDHSRFAFVQTIGGVLHFLSGVVVLNFRQPYFRQGVWPGLIFLFILTLHFRITRFWCRSARCRRLRGQSNLESRSEIAPLSSKRCKAWLGNLRVSETAHSGLGFVINAGALPSIELSSPSARQSAAHPH